MSAELGRDHDHHFAILPRDRSSLDAFRKACSYGPFSYWQAAIVGFIVGSVMYLAGKMALNAAPVQLNAELPVFLVLALGGPMLALGSALIGNYLIGRRVQEEIELERALYGEGTLPPPLPRPDVPGIDLLSKLPRKS